MCMWCRARSSVSVATCVRSEGGVAAVQPPRSLHRELQLNAAASRSRQSAPSATHVSATHASDVHASDLNASDLHASDPHASDPHPSDCHASDLHASDLHASDVGCHIALRRYQSPVLSMVQLARFACFVLERASLPAQARPSHAKACAPRGLSAMRRVETFVGGNHITLRDSLRCLLYERHTPRVLVFLRSGEPVCHTAAQRKGGDTSCDSNCYASASATTAAGSLTKLQWEIRRDEGALATCTRGDASTEGVSSTVMPSIRLAADGVARA
eukprot:CAMPEP_0181184780 /NCGR_PEP_ID=MMETSP1096-20121128/9151_1 /TAXON_ID=156174 ORGANISM="Chrysochromulina ericina, Strain CCMP281" /NCGR_SAMPLE_ID=MMETSP1096 /ASSEMBLY_ACC=CAM_ASM_000453 /LENGTH=271 /DNA_ID=CAMNT_0023273569 /DNA_START=467 /DNA_END=1282 /DNA_ORIENTATION=+